MSLFDAAVDLNPHQIEAALFALHSPLSKGVMLADEVGLGKTIEAGIVLCQLWAERKRRLLVICPASLRSQWAAELSEKFNLPVVVVDAKTRRQALRNGRDPIQGAHVVIASFHFINSLRDEISLVPWDLVVIDEAHKLRNVYRPSNKVGKGIQQATAGRRKLLLTATPLQNSLLELYGLSTLIDDRIFGDLDSFRSQFTGAGSNLTALKQRVRTFATRTLRQDVTEYIRYTSRLAMTQPFTPSSDEQQLYEEVSERLQRDELYALPTRQRHLTTLILRKLLASSSDAIAATLRTLRKRVAAIADQPEALANSNLFGQLDLTDDLDDADVLLEEILGERSEGEDDFDDDEASGEHEADLIDLVRLRRELDDLDRLIELADSIKVDAKTPALLSAIEVGFERMAELGAQRKALIFTESRKTQEYLKNYLEANGHRGDVVAFNGSNNGPDAKSIYDRWVADARQSGRKLSSRSIDIRAALIEHFRDDASIMIATEAAAEGVNLQFCSFVVNYDLPWNPQRVEQRIGRCHRYGQLHDVVVVNFLNERNEADKRVLELLDQKFRLFSGVFGASDEILGSVDSGVDFEQRILAIYQRCRTPTEIEQAFDDLQQEMDEHIRARMETTRRQLFEHFDEDVHERLRLRLADTQARLDHFGRRLWAVTRYVLNDHATFDERVFSFTLNDSPIDAASAGAYHFFSAAAPKSVPGELYRVSHPLGEHVLDQAKETQCAAGLLTFDISGHANRVAVVEQLAGRSGVVTLEKMVVDSFEREDYLLFSAQLDDGSILPSETVDKMFSLSAEFNENEPPAVADIEHIVNEADRRAAATMASSLDMNNEHFRSARDQLEQWADDLVLSAERTLTDTKQQIKMLRREARMAPTLSEQHAVQEQLKRLERKQRKQRQEIFDVEDEVAERRDELIGALERRMSQTSSRETLFTVRFAVV